MLLSVFQLQGSAAAKEVQQNFRKRQTMLLSMTAQWGAVGEFAGGDRTS